MSNQEILEKTKSATVRKIIMEQMAKEKEGGVKTKPKPKAKVVKKKSTAKPKTKSRIKVTNEKKKPEPKPQPKSKPKAKDAETWVVSGDEIGVTFDQLNFPVQMTETFIKIGDKMEIVPDKYGVYRSDSNSPLSVMGKNYLIVPYGDVITDLEEGFNKMKLNFDARHNLTKGGRRIYSEYRFPDVTFTPKGMKDDITTMRLIVPNSYDGSRRIGFQLGGYRLICSNGITIGETLFSLNASHTKGLDYKDLVTKVKLATDSFATTVIPFWNAMNEATINENKGLKIIERMIPDNSKKTMLEQKRKEKINEFGKGLSFRYREKVQEKWLAPKDKQEKPRNLWTLYNSFTNVVTHDIEANSYERAQKMNVRVTNQFQQLMGAN